MLDGIEVGATFGAGTGAVSVYDPSDDFNSSVMKLWVDASIVDYKTSTYQDYFIMNGSQVSAWQDRSGNNNHIVQSTASLQPTTSSLSGKRIMNTDGTNYMDFTNSITGVRFIAAAFTKTAISNKNFLVYGAATTYYAAGLASTPDKDIGRAGNATVGSGSFNISGSVWRVGFYNYDGTNLTIYQNNIAGNSIVGGGTPLTFSKFLYNTTNTYYLNGGVAEMIMLTTNPTTGQRSSIYNYLSRKWSI